MTLDAEFYPPGEEPPCSQKDIPPRGKATLTESAVGLSLRKRDKFWKAVEARDPKYALIKKLESQAIDSYVNRKL